MFEGLTTPEGIIELVMTEIDRLGGLDKAFPHEGRIQLYSGPNWEYFVHLIGTMTNNAARAANQTKEWDARRLDDTPMGDFIFVKNKLYEWFGEVHKSSPNKDFLVDRDAKKVTSFVSSLFARTISGDVQTCVCGAARDRVFCETEIHTLCDRTRFPVEAESLVAAILANKDIETINGTPIDQYRKIYATGNYEKDYLAICRSELRQRLKKATKEKDIKIYTDYLDRKELYEYDLVYMKSPAIRLPIHQRVLRDRNVREAEKAAMIEKFRASIDTPTKPAKSVRHNRKTTTPAPR
jgi:hypothetical protein